MNTEQQQAQIISDDQGCEAGLPPTESTIGRLLRFFALPSVNGREINLSDYRRYKNLVLFFHHGAACPVCQKVVQQLTADPDAYRQDRAVFVSISPDTPAPLGPESDFVALRDTDNHALQQQGFNNPSVIVTDRYGEIFAVWDGGATHDLPCLEDITEWLTFIENLCVDCTPQRWESRG
ncbi:MAG: redoxin domain-containing protein [Anaerolineae bacterium]|nr:redoxin domain-containing protein [Anaerolineae bacterium]